jgi:hypothetical protein
VASADVDLDLNPDPPDIGGDATSALPAVWLRDKEVLGPSTARITGLINLQDQSSSVSIQYGVDGVLDSQSQSVAVEAGAGSPTEVIADLTDLDPDTSYGARLVVNSAAGTTASSIGRFGTLASMTVSPTTGTPSAKGTSCTIVGTAGRDVLKGTSRKDVICGLGGNDSIRGLGGNDRILGGPGKDTVGGAATIASSATAAATGWPEAPAGTA